jgi:quinolinate synthase
MTMSRIIADIEKLKKERNAVILAHNYQLPEIQDIADYLGDSLGLSIQASRTDKDVIVFCGVYFMAETAKILSPHKTVLISDLNARCPMADMITASELRALKARHPAAKTLCYVNTPAEVKAECDLCCTSANAVKMAEEAFDDEDEVIFVPDKYLANYVSGRTGRQFITWHGYCSAHVKILENDIIRQKKLHPKAEVIVHPECTPDVIKLANRALSTEGMCKYAKESHSKEIIVGTETGVIYRLKKENPKKKIYPASDLSVCPNMKLTTLEKVLSSLERMEHKVELSQDVIIRAAQSIQRMVQMAL